MKKALAILLVLLMVCSTVVAMIPAHATEEPTDWEAVANELGLALYVGAEVATAPVQDGAIADGEYTATKTTALANLSVPQDGSTEVQGENVVEYFAHDASHYYYAIVFEQTNDNRACWPQFMVNNSFNVFTNDAGDNINDFHNRAALQARYLEDGTTKNNGISKPRGAAEPTYGEDADFWVVASKSAENVKTYEFKFAKSYFATAAGVEVADVRVIPTWTFFHATTSTAHILTEDEMAVLTAAGVGEIRDFGVGKNMYNFIVLDEKAEEPDPYRELLHNMGLNTYVGAAMEVSPVVDGVVNAGEYSYSKTWAPEEIYSYGTEIQSGVDEFIAHDADYIYYAVRFTQEANNRALQFQFQPTNTFRVFNSKDDLRTTLFQRITWQLRYQDDGTTTLAEAPKFNYAIEDAAPQVGEGLDIEYAATKTAENVKTYEIKLAKAYIANYSGCEVEDVNVLPYFTYFHSACALGHNYTTEETEAIKALGATRADTGLIYRFIVLEEAPPFSPMDVLGADYTDSALAENVATAPVQDGAIGADEYSFSRVIKPYDHLLPDESAEAHGEEYANVITEYFAHDADYIYYAYNILRDDTPTQGYVIFVPLENRYMLDSIGTPANRQLNASKALTITGSTGTTCSVVADGADAPEVGTDVAVNKVVGENNTTYTEIKISKQYLADARGVDKSEITSFEYSVYENWNYYAVPAGASWGYITIDHHVTADEAAIFTAAGAKKVPARIYNTVKLVEAPAAPVIDSLDDLYAPTYVGAPLAADAAKPVADSYIRAGEYQVAYVVPATYNGHSARNGAAANLLDDFTTYVAHDADYFYVAFEFYNGDTAGRGRLYWNLSFIDSFNITYGGGTTINTAFLNNGYGIVDGWNFGAEVKADLSEGFSGRNNAVTRGTAPVQGEDFDVAIWKEDLGAEVSATTHQVYEFKVSKAWYAAQVGLESAADVRELAWTNQGQYINEFASSYTQIGHHLTAEDLAALAAAGFNYTVPNTASHPYDNSMLPLLFVLDADPNGDDATMVPAEDVNAPAEPVDPPVTEDSTTEIPTQPSTQPATTAPATTTEAPATTTAKATTKAATTAAATTAAETEADTKGCKGSIAISALVLVPTLAGGALLLKRRKED